MEEYLHNRGDNFVKRFDANSYLYITRAIDSFDVSRGKELYEVFKGIRAKVLVLAFKSDWLYPASQSREIVRACKLAGIDTTYCEIDSTYGHDAFLLEVEEETHLVKHFLQRVFLENGVTGEIRCCSMTSNALPLEYRAILEWIRQGSSVLDLGCGDGELLTLLVREKKVRAQGIEIDEQAIYQCVAKGLSVFHEDIDNGLSGYRR